MQTIWRSLLWREWHEHKWKLAALSAILLAVQAYLIFNDPGDAPPPIMFWYGCLIPGAFFVALGTATGERTLHTLEFVRALPIKTWQAAAVKLGMAMVACLAPLAFSALAAAVWSSIWQLLGGAGAPQFAISEASTISATLLGLVAAGLVTSVLFWVTAAAIGQPNELRASAAGAVMLCGWIAVSMFAAVRHDHLPPGAAKTLWECLVAVGPGGFLLLLADDAHPRLDLALQLSSLVAVAAWTLRRFGWLGACDNRSASAAAAPQGGAPPTLARASWRPVTAIAWKQWREAAPLCLAGMAFVAGFAVIRTIVMKDSPLTGTGATTLRTMILSTGALTAMIVAVGSFASDLQPEIWAFWRSRPISPAAWFWTKYLSGAAAVLLFLDGPLVAMDLLGSRGPLRSLTTDAVLDCSLVLHLFAYTVAACMTCWVRQGVYSGILSVAAVFAVLLAPINRPSLAWLDWTKFPPMDRNGFAGDLWFSSVYLPFAGCMAALTLAAALLAWRGVEREHGLADWVWGVVFRSAKERPFAERKAT